jgi:heterodisulfide reductase subunit B/ferredoxin
MDNRGYIMFWGCTIQARFSFMEKATRLVFERLGIDYRDAAGFTCCPEKALVGSLSEDLWLSTAAMNLAVADRDTLITPCNGCYSVLKYDEIISALGATPVHYRAKMLCCGGGLTNIGRPEETRNIIRTKLQELKGLNADAITTSCPSCFSQLDIIQATMMREGENLGIPIITLSELLLLAMGYEEDELFFSSHRVSADSFLKRFGSYRTKEFPISLDTIERCVACEACREDCPANINLGIDLHALMKRILEEPLDEVILSPDIWRCLECHTCVELCPQVFGMEKAIKELKRMAVEKGYEPQLVKKTIDTYTKTGKIGEPSKTQRKKLGLPDAPESGVEGWKRLVGKLQNEK